MKKKILAGIVVIVLSLMNCLTVFADQTASSYNQQQKQVQQQKNNIENQLNQVEGELDTARQEVEELNTSISSVEDDISEISIKIENLENSIKQKEKDLKEKQVLLDERLSAAYMNNNNTYLEAIFTGGFINFVSNYDMIKQIAEYDNNLINEVKDTKSQLESEKVQVVSEKEQKEQKSAELKKLKNQKQAKVDNLTEEQKNLQKKSDEYEAEMKALDKKEKEALAAAEAAAKKQGGSSSGSVSTKGTGQLTWPVPASHNISSPYGYRIHPIYKTKKFHSGIDIAAASGTNIVAADSGTVILASYGYNGGYGNYIIINHSNGMTTRYAHCSALNVSVGQSVSRGQVIGKVGSTGASTGPHCHFEVRINGETQNPQDYV